MAGEAERDPSTWYTLMEDKDQDKTGRRMTLPNTSVSTPNPVVRTSTFSTPSAPSTAAVAAEDTATPQPDISRRPETARTGILRQSTSTDFNISSDESAPKKRVKKQVSITLPGSARPLSEPPSRQRENERALSAIEEDGGSDESGPQEVVVEVDVQEETETTDEDARGSAAELLNGDVHKEANGTSSGSGGIHLRDNPKHRNSKRKSMRQSLTNSLSRIGSRMRRKPPKLQRLQSALDLDKLAQNELELKANLYWHIGTPIKRWKVERQVPVKLVLQLLKTFCLIVQIVLFTQTIPHKRAEFFFDSRIVFESMFTVDFDPEAVLQQHILYSIEQVSRELEHIATNYYKLPATTIGGYDHVKDENGEPVPLQLHLKQYRQASLNASEMEFVLDGHIDDVHFTFSRTEHENITQELFNVSQDPNFHKFVKLHVEFPINVIRIEAPQKAECYRFNIAIVFENDDHNGKIFYYLKINYRRLRCDGTILKDRTSYDVIMGALVTLDLVVLGFCGMSLFLTMKTLRRGYRLGKAMGQFYHDRLHLPLSWWERRSLFSPWHYFNITSDILISSGTIYKILLEFDLVLHASVARILLGSALLFQAGVILRYINYFKQFNALTRTLALAFPELVKFLSCGAVLFFAFALCGWIVLGPFHPKFASFNDSIETLFSLLNGDDIYNTYIGIEPQVDLAAYIYSRFFLYIFLGLFVYAVLNLFTSLIISAYEISQNKDTATGNEVRRFVFSGPLTPRGAALRDVTSTSKFVEPAVILNKAQKKKRGNSSDDDYE